MDLQRLAVKLYLDEDSCLAREDAFRLFSAWIPATPEEVLIDVADYSHVGTGPLVVLVGHEADRALDNAGGRPGLLYSRKRPVEGSLPDRLAAALRAALVTCHRLEQSPGAGVRFRTDEVLVIANDRLCAPNEASTLEAMGPALAEVFDRLYGGESLTIERHGEPLERFAVRVLCPVTEDVDTLLTRLGS